MSKDLEAEFGAFFDALADTAGSIALRYFRKSYTLDEKDDKSPVTQADKEIEQALRDQIGKKFPHHGIIGEEFGSYNAGADYVWVIDPIDGTKAFATGRPTFGTILGLAHLGRPKMGLIDQPFSKERWFGIDESFCRHNGVPVKVAAPRALTGVRFHTTDPSMFNGGFEDNLADLIKAVKWPIYSCDCYAYGLLAAGWIDLVVERKLKVHDVMGVVPLITGAGGSVSQWDGNAITLDMDGTIIAASSNELRTTTMDMVKKRAA